MSWSTNWAANYSCTNILHVRIAMCGKRLSDFVEYPNFALATLEGECWSVLLFHLQLALCTLAHAHVHVFETVGVRCVASTLRAWVRGSTGHADSTGLLDSSPRTKHGFADQPTTLGAWRSHPTLVLFCLSLACSVRGLTAVLTSSPCQLSSPC